MKVANFCNPFRKIKLKNRRYLAGFLLPKEVSVQMVIDVIGFFRDVNHTIRTAIIEAYPDNSLDKVCSIRSLNKIAGCVASLNSCLKNRIEKEEKENAKFRSLDSEWKPSDESREDNSQSNFGRLSSIDYFLVLNQFLITTDESLAFYKKLCDGAAHGQLQKLLGASEMLTAFLDSIDIDDPSND